MHSNLVTPPDIVNNGLHSVTLVDPSQADVDAVIRLCQVSDQVFNIYVYTPNMHDRDWLNKAVDASDAVLVNIQSDEFKDLWIMNKVHYYGSRVLLENPRKLSDPLHYFASLAYTDK